MISTPELDAVLSACVSCYQGTFAIDELPTGKLSRPSCFICNTDASYLPGTHWMAVCLPPQQHLLYFIDPYDLPLHRLLSPLNKWMKQYECQVQTLPFSIQPLRSILCGAYCAFLLAHLQQWRYDLVNLTDHMFHPYDLQQNDALMREWWYKIKRATNLSSVYK